MLEDAQNNVMMNKNMIKIIVDHQDQSDGLSDDKGSNSARGDVIVKMNDENTALLK